MEEKTVKAEKNNVAKAVVWTLIAFFVMLFCMKSCLGAAHKQENDTIIAERDTCYNKLQSYQTDTIDFYSHRIDSLQQLIIEDSVLVRELAIKQFVENKFQVFDDIYASFVKTNGTYINEIRNNRIASADFNQRMKLENELIDSLNSLKLILDEGFSPSDSIFGNMTKWFSTYSQLITDKRELIRLYIAQGYCCENPPKPIDEGLLDCDRCRQCPEYLNLQRRLDAKSGGSQAQSDLKVLMSRDSLIKRDIAALLALHEGRNQDRKLISPSEVNKILKRYWP